MQENNTITIKPTKQKVYKSTKSKTITNHSIYNHNGLYACTKQVKPSITIIVG